MVSFFSIINHIDADVVYVWKLFCSFFHRLTRFHFINFERRAEFSVCLETAGCLFPSPKLDVRLKGFLTAFAIRTRDKNKFDRALPWLA